MGLLQLLFLLNQKLADSAGFQRSAYSADTMNTSELIEKDLRLLWHPYSSIYSEVPVYPVADASGCRITLANGRVLVDGMSSWWTSIHGYKHPVLDQAIKSQLGKFAHVMFGGLTHEPAVALAERIVGLLPASLSRVFLSDSGSVAVEVALKMALQYWSALGRTNKKKIFNDFFGLSR